MSLIVTITKAGGSPSYSLKADKVTHTFVRFATQSPLPADASGNPQVFTLDLGMSLEEILVTGIVDSTGTPSKTNLESVCRTWWDYGTAASGLPTLVIDTGVTNSYFVHVKQADFSREGGIEDRWNMSLIFLVRAAA